MKTLPFALVTMAAFLASVAIDENAFYWVLVLTVGATVIGAYHESDPTPEKNPDPEEENE